MKFMDCVVLIGDVSSNLSHGYNIIREEPLKLVLIKTSVFDCQDLTHY